MAIRLLTPKTTYTTDYPAAIDFAETQSGIFWLPTEIEVEKDLHTMKTNMSESEYHGIVSTLKLFTLYELSVGSDYWGNYISQVFPRPDIQRMANCFSYFEINVHAPFYDKINKLLGLDNDEFYTSYLNDPVLKNRMEWIGKRTTKRDTIFNILKSVGIFSMIEGSILYSSFAFIKSFNNAGKSKLSAINAGINFSISDESLHSMAGAWLFRTCLSEAINDNAISDDEINQLHDELIETTGIILEHESIIIDKIFDKGPIKGISATQLKSFVESRLDVCLDQLGYKAHYKPKYNPIKTWFYKDVESGAVLHDFFNSMGSSYNRNWISNNFTW